MAGLRKQHFPGSLSDTLIWRGTLALGESLQTLVGTETVTPQCLFPWANGQQKVTVLCLFGVLLPDVGLSDPEVSSSSAEDQEDRSYVEKRFF